MTIDRAYEDREMHARSVQYDTTALLDLREDEARHEHQMDIAVTANEKKDS